MNTNTLLCHRIQACIVVLLAAGLLLLIFILPLVQLIHRNSQPSPTPPPRPPLPTQSLS